jgi:hypothetical protein
LAAQGFYSSVVGYESLNRQNELNSDRHNGEGFRIIINPSDSHVAPPFQNGTLITPDNRHYHNFAPSIAFSRVNE